MTTTLVGPRDTSSAPATTTGDPHHVRRWLVLAVLGLAQLMIILDGTIVNIALPTAQRALAFSNADRQWVVTAYALAFGSLLLLGGRLSDLFGKKTTFLVGLVGFAVASAIGGAANGFTMLIVARSVQGAFAALLAPSVLALLTTTFTDPAERNKAFGIYGGISGAGGAIGLLLGGVLTSYVSWRWTLFVNLFFAVLALIGGKLLLHNQRAAEHPRLDVPGAVTASAGLFALVYGFSRADTAGWASPATFVPLVVGVSLLLAFFALESRVARPLLPPRVLLDRNRGGAYLSILIAGIGMFGIFLFLTYYLQGTLGYSPIRTGLSYIPMVALLSTVGALANTKLLPRFGPRRLVPLGMLIVAGGMAALTRLGFHSSYAGQILPSILVLGLGIGLVMAPSMNTATLGVNRTDAGVASAMVNTSQQVGGSIGTSLLNTIAVSASTSYLVAHHAGAVPSRHLVALATLHSYTTAFGWAAGLLLVGAAASLLLLRPGAPHRGAPVAEAVPVTAH